ncbi:winged helix-turn-helix transcriptional regulator [Aquibacillus salsiterrae]|uniref:Helix-turn-helix transcriptional regulator n=1 Tax=Aquibacillus salsiterrae TaxID=2950439 RepID=A0A9X3WFB2_9BACI|nr:helix-turn-helix domain-containing protein [Aquibacillus salsiterrae]MDC3417396.1 helix-turn-helix transcriptional regulator [Aquibacillus salsiterrae]
MKNIQGKELDQPIVIDCSIEKALNIIGSKWSFLILRELFTGTKRFSELQRAINGVSPKALTDALRHMEENEILVRTVYPTVPVKVEYSLTEKGQDLHKIIKEMKYWGAKWG